MIKQSTSHRSPKRRARQKAIEAPGLLEELPTGMDAFASPLRRLAQRRQAAPDYGCEIRRPVVCLTFILPLLLVYELGSIFLDQLSGRSGVDQWLHHLMQSIGFGQLIVLPWLTAGALLYWHHRLNDFWSFKPQILLGMIFESSCLGIILYFAGNAVIQIAAPDGLASALTIADRQWTGWWQSSIAYLGCGVYEELIFRLILFNGLIRIGKKCWHDGNAKCFGILVTSLLFAGLHYEIFNPAGAAFDSVGFLYRFSASVVFCLVFLFRGFGIAVGAHVIYDIMTQV